MGNATSAADTPAAMSADEAPSDIFAGLSMEMRESSGLGVPSALTAATPKPGTVAVLGGSFDPITDGHLKCACEIIHARMATEVWIVPCGVRPDKPSLKTPYMQRLIMCHLAVNTTFGSQFPIRVCDVEMLEEKALSTYHLMLRLKREYPSKLFKFCIGADLVSSIKQWDAPGVPDAGERLYNECEFLVMERPGFALPADLPKNFALLRPLQGTTIVTEELSSSEIRKRITSKNFGDTERTELEEGNFSMVDGLLTPAVLCKLYARGA
jgi:nicotinate (nicotinamide) nucleotide adenylyltransferase